MGRKRKKPVVVRKNPMDVANKVIDEVRGYSKDCIVMMSLGKDSIVTLDLLYEKFERIVCVFMYLVKDLEHIQRWINWLLVRYPRIEFEQIPHWNTTYNLRWGIYCTPNPKVRILNLSMVIKSLKERLGIGYVFFGMKKADSMNRRLMLKSYESENYIHGGNCYPLADFTQKQVLQYMKHRHLPKPIMYARALYKETAEVGGASGGLSLDLDCFLWLRENAPSDLERIYKVFPQSRVILFRYDQEKKDF